MSAPPLRLKIVRDEFHEHCALGKLYSNGIYFCETLEDTDRKLESGGVKIYGQTAIPRGTYKIELSVSPRFGKLMPVLLHVPGFTGIRIHAGNDDSDTDGCILVGVVRGDKRIINSRVAWQRLMILLEDAWSRNEDIEIEVR